MEGNINKMWEKVAEGYKRVAKAVIGESRVICQRIIKYGRGQKKCRK